MTGHYEQHVTDGDFRRDPIDYMGACSDRAYVTARLGEQGLMTALGSRYAVCDQQPVLVGVQVEQPMLPIEEFNKELSWQVF